ncbi:uncharacterized protein K02A2.6-like [Lucilia cuprina]|uniref:uncharacterized protein K02A2.6-like n=1 Tax=Lucilia cuprina TaxID=7375 RepID=UPI001F06D0A9|nr:uncharacterized protein K02A2.6-like [Lucilia cuprina]
MPLTAHERFTRASDSVIKFEANFNNIREEEHELKMCWEKVKITFDKCLDDLESSEDAEPEGIQVAESKFQSTLTVYARCSKSIKIKIDELEAKTKPKVSHHPNNDSNFDNFKWSNECREAFNKLKKEIASDRVLMPYDPELPLQLACDASPTGIAGVLSHLVDGEERPIAFASRSLTSAEQNYSQLDREALAIYYAVQYFHEYLFGRQFNLITDNQPLMRIIHQNNKLPQMTSATLQRLSFGKIREETQNDEKLFKILYELRHTAAADSEFTIDGNILFKGQRIMIPSSLQDTVLKELHHTHIGTTKMKQLARRYVYWMGIDKDIEKFVRACPGCASIKSSSVKAPLHPWEEPDNNWERIHIDYAGPYQGQYFLMVVDAKSKWIEVGICTAAPTSASTIEILLNIFTRNGYPDVMVSDNATIFKSDTFSSFCQDCGIFQKFIAPGHPATNGLAERNIQTLKNKLAAMSSESSSTQEKIRDILLKYRTTPLKNGKTPSELFLGRPIRSRLDILKPPKIQGNQQDHIPSRQLRVGKRVQARYYTPNKSLWKLGIIVRKMGRLQYIVKLDDGYVFKRHIDQLLSTNIQAETSTNAHSSPEQLIFQHASIYNPNLNNNSEDGPVENYFFFHILRFY